MTKPDSDDTAQYLDLDRRTFMAATAATGAAAVGVGTAAAAGLDYSSDYVHDPWLDARMTIENHDRATFDSVLEYINDSGERVSLADAGGQVATPTSADESHNPVSIRADKIDAEEFRAFPRGESYDESGDGEEDTDVRALDATHWSTDTSGSAGSLTVEDVESPAGATALHVAASGQGDGDVALATFDNFEAITDGVDRKHLQLVATVDSLASAAFYVRVKDSAGNVKETWIDSSADSTATGTITTETGPAQVYQVQLGELSTDLGDLVEVELSVQDGDADVTFTALNLERESTWEFGSQEYLNSDDEVDTETITEPSGAFAITGLDSLGSPFDAASITDLEVDVEYAAGRIGADGSVEFDWSDAERYDQDSRLKHLIAWDLPTAYDLGYSDVSLKDTVLFPSTRYIAGEVAVGLDSVPSLDDVDDVSWTDKTATYEDGSIDTDVTLSTSPTGGEIIAVHLDVLYSESERDKATASGGGGGPMQASSSDGFLSTPLGLLTTLGAGVAGYFGIVRGLLNR
jgi:hypothetical protein